jgi:hypothetical protein
METRLIGESFGCVPCQSVVNTLPKEFICSRSKKDEGETEDIVVYYKWIM